VHGWDFEVKQTSREATITFAGTGPVFERSSLRRRVRVVAHADLRRLRQRRACRSISARERRGVSLAETADARIKR
jgi:hypothetical protein